MRYYDIESYFAKMIGKEYKKKLIISYVLIAIGLLSFVTLTVLMFISVKNMNMSFWSFAPIFPFFICGSAGVFLLNSAKQIQRVNKIVNVLKQKNETISFENLSHQARLPINMIIVVIKSAIRFKHIEGFSIDYTNLTIVKE